MEKRERQKGEKSELFTPGCLLVTGQNSERQNDNIIFTRTRTKEISPGGEERGR